jgi:hypothetical protein
VRKEIEFYLEDLKDADLNPTNVYGINPGNLYEGLFTRQGRDFAYTINHTKRVCYSLEQTRILAGDRGEKKDMDPLPFLMAYGSMGIGEWLGDVVGVSDSIPKGYSLLDDIKIDW